jgi:hypothetical protein
LGFLGTFFSELHATPKSIELKVTSMTILFINGSILNQYQVIQAINKKRENNQAFIAVFVIRKNLKRKRKSDSAKSCF